MLKFRTTRLLVTVALAVAAVEGATAGWKWH
jgi:hypothetical protein